MAQATAECVPARRYMLSDCVHATFEILDRLNVANVDWLGNAWGGHVGVLAAVASPARVRTLTAIGAPMQALEPSMRWKSRVASHSCASVRAGSSPIWSPRRWSPRRSRLAITFASHRSAPRGGIELAIRSVSLGRTDLAPKLLAVPTMFVVGADDAMWSQSIRASRQRWSVARAWR